MSTSLALQPRILDWMSPEEKEFRAHFPEAIKKLPAHSFLDAATFTIDGYFTGHNVSSVVCRVRDKNGTYVVKSISEPHTLLIEIEFLRRWREVGAQVVNVLELTEPNKDFNIRAAIMEYIPADTTGDALAQQRDKTLPVYEKLGQALAVMHRAKGKGFGKIVNIENLQTEHATFKEEIESLITPEQQGALVASGLLEKNDVSLIARAVEVVERNVHSGIGPSLLHDDVGVHNTFGIDTITFFDPDPKISNPLIDLAIAYIWALIATGDQRSLAALARGYQSESPYDELSLQACLFLKLLEKWEWWLQRGKSEPFALEWIDKTKPLFMNAKNQIRTH